MLDDLSIAVIAFVIVASAFFCAFCFAVLRVRRHRQTSRLRTGRVAVVRREGPSRIAE